MKIHTKGDYRAARRARYPELGEQLDAILALAEHLRASGQTLPEKTLRWLEACQDVKARIRKD
jgi:hypothetical protein